MIPSMIGGYFQDDRGAAHWDTSLAAMGDDDYRVILRAKAAAMNTSGTISDIYQYLVDGFGIEDTQITNDVGIVTLELPQIPVLKQGDRYRSVATGPRAAGVDLFFANWPAEHPEFSFGDPGSFKINQQDGEHIIVPDVGDGQVKVLWCTDASGEYGSFEATVRYGVSRGNLAYGEWEFWVCWSGSNYARVMFVASTGGNPSGAGGPTGYLFEVDADGRYCLKRRNVGGTLSAITQSDTGYMSADTWYKIKITRAANGLFTCYRDDALMTAGTGYANPASNTTFTEGGYVSIRLYQDSGIVLSNFEDECLFNYTPL